MFPTHNLLIVTIYLYNYAQYILFKLKVVYTYQSYVHTRKWSDFSKHSTVVNVSYQLLSWSQASLYVYSKDLLKIMVHMSI